MKVNALVAIAVLQTAAPQDLYGEIQAIRARARALAEQDADRSGGESATANGQDRSRLLFEARSAVLAILREPASARFRNVREMVPLPTGEVLFCGEVNSRNGLGGYTGFVRFQAYAGPNGYRLAEIDAVNQTDWYFAAAWGRNCRGGSAVTF